MVICDRGWEDYRILELFCYIIYIGSYFFKVVVVFDSGNGFIVLWLFKGFDFFVVDVCFVVFL